MGKKGKSKGRGKGRDREHDRKASLGYAQELAPGASPVAVAFPLAAPPVGQPGAVAGTSAAGPRASATELAAQLAGLSTVLQRHLSRVDTGDGLTRARLSALALLVLGGPRTLGELAAAEHVRPPTMTRLVQAMEADGLVIRERNPHDGRSMIIHATRAGEAQLAEGRARQIAPLAASVAELGDGQRRRLEDAADLLGWLLRETRWEAVEPEA